MRKLILSAAIIFASSSAFAQDLVTKKGEPILPQAGDYALSVDASPFLRYVGNFIGGNGLNAAPTMNFLSGAVNQVVTVKYFVTDKMAYRAGLRLGFDSNKNELGFNTGDYRTVGTSNVGLTAGLEYRRGNGRLQGYYGAEAGLAFDGGSSSWSYKNDLSATNTNGGVARSIKTSIGTTLNLGVRGFLGVEYFVLPKISIGGEFGWGVAFASSGLGKNKTEEWDGTKVITTESDSGTKTSSFSVDTDNLNSVFGPAGTLRINFHF